MMNLKRFSIGLLLALSTITSQAQNPTLAVGLETLTMNKGTIDVEALTEIIMEKQQELKQEALKRFMLKLFPETNYTTKFYVQNCLTILLNEKNPQVIEKEILELTTNYALVLGIAAAYHNMRLDTGIASYFLANKYHITAFRFKSTTQHQITESSRLGAINMRLSNIDKKIDSLLTDASPKIDEARSLETKRIRLDKRSKRKQIEENIDLRQKPDIETFPFGLLCDVVAASLSEMPELRNKGFFKRAINYKQDNFYQGLSSQKEKEFKDKLDTLQTKIRETIKPYIVSYDVIKEYFKVKIGVQTGATIKEQLIANYTNKFIEIAGGIGKVENIISKSDDQTLGKNIQTAITPVTKLSALQRRLQQLAASLRDLKTEIKNKSDITTKYSLISATDTAQIKTRDSLQTKLVKSISNLQGTINSVYTEIKGNLTEYKIDIANINYMALNDTVTVNTGIADLSSTTSGVGTLLLATSIKMIKQGNLHEAFLSNLLRNMSNLEGFKVTSSDPSLMQEIAKYSEGLSDFFVKLTKFSQQEAISLKDINFIDEEVVPYFIKYSLLLGKNGVELNKNIKQFQLLSTLLKIKAITDVGKIEEYHKDFVNLFSFISNLDNLDKAESYQFILNLMQSTDQHLEQNLEEGKFKEVYLLFTNAIKKYTLINTNEQYVSIDVISFLTEMQQYFSRNNTSRFDLYLTLGLNQNFFISPVTLPDNTRLNNIGFASEKLGLKVRIHSFNRYKGYENTIKTDINLNKRAPFINEIYAIAYGSGLLYSIANTATETKFDYAHVGGGIGLRFYNALDVNLIAGFPFIKGQSPWKNAFWGVGLDIPLGEYLEKIGNKKK